jgi:hypothetical protein
LVLAQWEANNLAFEHSTELSDTRYRSPVIRRFYVHNFHCLENFGLPAAGQPSILLIGNNDVGKTTVGLALEASGAISRSRCVTILRSGWRNDALNPARSPVWSGTRTAANPDRAIDAYCAPLRQQMRDLFQELEMAASDRQGFLSFCHTVGQNWWIAEQ